MAWLGRMSCFAVAFNLLAASVVVFADGSAQHHPHMPMMGSPVKMAATPTQHMPVGMSHMLMPPMPHMPVPPMPHLPVPAMPHMPVPAMKHMPMPAMKHMPMPSMQHMPKPSMPPMPIPAMHPHMQMTAKKQAGNPQPHTMMVTTTHAGKSKTSFTADGNNVGTAVKKQPAAASMTVHYGQKQQTQLPHPMATTNEVTKTKKEAEMKTAKAKKETGTKKEEETKPKKETGTIKLVEETKPKKDKKPRATTTETKKASADNKDKKTTKTKSADTKAEEKKAGGDEEKHGGGGESGTEAAEHGGGGDEEERDEQEEDERGPHSWAKGEGSGEDNGKSEHAASKQWNHWGDNDSGEWRFGSHQRSDDSEEDE